MRGGQKDVARHRSLATRMESLLDDFLLIRRILNLIQYISKKQIINIILMKAQYFARLQNTGVAI